jgi:hypothetical protein
VIADLVALREQLADRLGAEHRGLGAKEIGGGEAVRLFDGAHLDGPARRALDVVTQQHEALGTLAGLGFEIAAHRETGVAGVAQRRDEPRVGRQREVAILEAVRQRPRAKRLTRRAMRSEARPPP